MIRSSLIVSFLSAASSAIAFFNQVLLARILGAGTELDSYLVAIALPLTISGLAVGVLSFQIVPSLRERPGEPEADASLLALVIGLSGGSLCLALAGIGTLPWSMPLFASRMPSDSLPAIAHAAAVAWGWLPLAVAGTVLTAALHVREKFASATVVQSLPTLGAALGCLFGYHRLGIAALAWGQLAGYVVMVGLLVMLLRPGWRRPDWEKTRHIVKHLPLALVSLLVFIIYPFADAIVGTNAGPSGVSLLGFAQRLIVGFSGLAVVGATTVLFPRLSEQAAQGRHATLKEDLARSLRIMLICMGPSAAVLSIVALPLVRFLFKRGAFLDADAVALAGLLPWMLGGMVGMSCMSVAFKALFAQRRIREAAAMSGTGAALYFLTASWLVRVFGLPGIGMAYAVTWWVLFFLALRAFKIRLGFNFWVRLSGLALLCAVSALIGPLCFPGSGETSVWVNLGSLIVSACAATATFGVASLVWPSIDEIKAIKRSLFKSHDR